MTNSEQLKRPEDGAGETPEQALESAKLREAMAAAEAQRPPKEADAENLSDEEKFKDFSAELEQTTTRGETMEKGAEFQKADIDFTAAIDHLKIHHDGEVAGSQFNGEVFASPQEVQALIESSLPAIMNYDQFNRAEITITKKDSSPIGYTGVKSIEEIKTLYPEADIKQEVRIPGGEPGVEDGVEGAWYPETDKNPETGRFEVVKDEAGNVKNPKGKFEPNVNIATVDAETFKKVAGTSEITVIIQKDRKTEKPVVLTIFPGENAPALPVKISTEDFKLNTLSNAKEEAFWKKTAFIKTAEKK